MSGFFEIGIINAKTETNVGTLWRSAYQLGAAGVFTIGKRYSRQSSDVFNVPAKIPLRAFECFEDLVLPFGSPLVVIEQGGVPLRAFHHPASCIYLLGAEDKGVPPNVIDAAAFHVSIPSLRPDKFNIYNVAVAGAIVMYDRMISTSHPRQG